MIIHRTMTPVAPVPEKVETAAHVYEYLDATGCNEPTLKLVAQFQQDDPDGNAQACLSFLMNRAASAGIQPGTITRLGKQINGPTWNWSPAGTVRTGSAVEKALELQVATLRDQLQEVQAKYHALMFENQKLRRAQDISNALSVPGRIDQSEQLATQVAENDEPGPRRRGRPPRVTGGIIESGSEE